MEDNQYIDYRGLTKRFGFKPGTAYALVHHGRIPHIRLSTRMVLFNVKEVEAWLAAHSVAVREKRGGRR